MKAFPDKKLTVARGFCDVHTPSDHAHELLIRIKEQRAFLFEKRKSLKQERDQIIKDGILSGNLNKCSRLTMVNKLLKDNGTAIHKMSTNKESKVDYNNLIVQRLREVTEPEVFVEACRLAALDRKFIFGTKPAVDVD